MAMDLKAYDTGTVYLFRAHLDTTKMVKVPDPTLPAPVDGQPDTRPLLTVPDPDWVCEWTWGKHPPTGRTAADFLADCKREAQALANLELARRQPPTEISLPM